jgi:hypothetical protein
VHDPIVRGELDTQILDTQQWLGGGARAGILPALRMGRVALQATLIGTGVPHE